MKSVKIILLGLIISFVACDDLLDIPNDNAITTSNFWKSEADIEKGVIAVYNMFYKQGTWTRNIHTQMNGMADDGVSYSGWVELREWTRFIFKNYNFSEVNTKIWTEHYKAIFRANQVLDHIDDIEFSDQKQKDDLKAQTLFLRSFYYFYLAILYEDVPLVLKTSSASDQPEQKTSDVIFGQIEKDLLSAIPMLPLTRDNKNKARITRGAAYALLSKTYMQQHKWDEAVDALYWLIEGEGKNLYDLVENYEDNFKADTENNKESVYEIQHSQVYTTGFDVDTDPNSNLGTQIAMNQSPKGLGWNNIQARRWLIDYYKREKTTAGDNDMRLYYNLWYNDASKDFPGLDHKVYGRDWTEDPTWESQVFIKKYCSKLPGRETEYYWHDINFRIFRYADFLLLYAEALNEKHNGPTTMAIECLNRVRNRSKLKNIENSDYYKDSRILTDKDAFRDHLKVERGLELCLECVRWIDLKRWGLDESSKAQLMAVDDDFNSFVVGKSHRLPIPQTDVDNNPNLNQNAPY